MLQVREAPTDAQRTAWDALAATAPSGSFLQSWAWGRFQEVAGFRIRRLMIEEQVSGTLRAVCLCIERLLPMKDVALYAPWGPVVAPDAPSLSERQEILRSLRLWAEHLRPMPVYVRIEPRLLSDTSTATALRRVGFLPVDRSVQPKDTLVVDLTQTEDALLRSMHSKTRYNIRLAMRHGVTVQDQTTPDGLQTFLHLAHDVERRGTFRYHPDGYYTAMLRALSVEKDMFHILVAVHRGAPLAAGLFITFGGTVTYAHGASTMTRAHVMAPTLLHWEAMLRARACGTARYDFFGIAPTKSPQHPWAGITRFKAGFGGTEEHFIGVADAALDPVRYRVYTVARGLRTLLQR